MPASMITLDLIGIGTGNPEHLTRQAIRVLNTADLVMIPRKGPDRADLADLREEICAEVLTNPATRFASFDMPRRDPATPDYARRVEDWHDAIAAVWAETLRDHLGTAGRAALLVWGDPALYDSSLRIAARLPGLDVSVVPGITALQALAAAHRIPLNAIGAPFLVTTGRRLREAGWPEGVDTLVVMLDEGGAFEALDPAGIDIWWGAYLGMPHEILRAGPLADTGPRILATRAEARTRHGWIMDIYLLRRRTAA